jgi:LacI family transcriptional regulator
MASISEVAAKAGVSITTVSRVINHSSHPVSPETRRRVLAAAKELNFAPSALARALAKSETHIIGVIVGDASDPYFSTIIRGITDEARLNGYLIIIGNSDRLAAEELDFVQLMRDYRADGLIFAGGGLTDTSYLTELVDILASFKNRQVPVVALGHHLIDAPQVTIDNRLAAQEMTDYLIGLGHRRIAFIAGPAILSTSAIREEGYRQALEQHGIPFDPTLVVEGNFTYEDGLRLAEHFLTLDPLPTAIFSSNDVMTIGCLVGLRQHGIKVPDQISLAGFDDITSVQYVDPPLTTVRVPMREMGMMGVRQLLMALKSDEPPAPQLVLQHELIVRASTAPPRLP